MKELKKFSNLYFAAIYLLCFLTGAIIKIVGGPGGAFLVSGLGLLFGHIIFSTLTKKGFLKLKITLNSILLLIAVYCHLIPYRTISGLIWTLSSMLIAFSIDILILGINKLIAKEKQGKNTSR